MCGCFWYTYYKLTYQISHMPWHGIVWWITHWAHTKMSPSSKWECERDQFPLLLLSVRLLFIPLSSVQATQEFLLRGLILTSSQSSVFSFVFFCHPQAIHSHDRTLLQNWSLTALRFRSSWDSTSYWHVALTKVLHKNLKVLALCHVISMQFNFVSFFRFGQTILASILNAICHVVQFTLLYSSLLHEIISNSKLR